MIKNLFILFLCVAGLGFAARAQAPQVSGQDRQAMTIHDCMSYAISQSTQIRIRQAESDDARIARREALLNAFVPSLSTGGSASYSFGRNIDPETNTYINTVSFSNGYSASAGMTLFNGFSAVNRIKISQTQLKMGRTREQQAEADLCLAVMEAYYNVVYYGRLAEIYEKQVADAGTSLQKAKRQEELGQKGHADVVQMEADLADRQYDLINTRNMYQDQKMLLADLMFWPSEEDLEIVTDFRTFADMQDDNMTPSVILNGHEASAIDFAVNHNPAIQLAAWNVDNARLELKTAKWQFLPSLSLSGGWSTSYYNYQGNQATPYLEMLKRNGGEYVSMSVSIPIFNRLSRQNTLARKRNALAVASAEHDQVRRDVEGEIRRAVRDRDGSAIAYQQAQRKAEVQEEAYSLNLKKLEQGLISPLEFQTANNNYLKAQADEMNSLFKYLIKQAVVRYYNGVEYVNQ